MQNTFTTEERALELDQKDKLRNFKNLFHIPQTESLKNEIYFCGNSLGLQPKSTSEYINDEMLSWQKLGVKGHFSGKNPWMPYHELVTEQLATLVGAKPSEVVAMNSLTVNLHLILASFYQPTSKRNKILIEKNAFPSDLYAVCSQASFHGFDANTTVIQAEHDDFQRIISEKGSEIAVVLIPGVQYLTGEVFPLQELTTMAKQQGCMVGADLAHAVGNIELKLHEIELDFAVWCHYKYLNSGPGSVGGCFVHEKHASNINTPRLAGWWGHDKNTRFDMDKSFQAIPTAEGWQLSNAPVLSLAALKASLDIFTQAGGMTALRSKSLALTDYFIELLQQYCPSVNILTPLEKNRRGCQLSLNVEHKNKTGREIFDELISSGITVDWRTPAVIRVAPVPLYNSFTDVLNFVQKLREILYK